jgi:hypothetical protein
MLRKIPQLNAEPRGIGRDESKSAVSVLHFTLLPGGISRALKTDEEHLNRLFSETVLESVKLLLAASLNMNRPEDMDGDSGEMAGCTDNSKQIERIISRVEDMRNSTDSIIGGFFPLLIAQKSYGMIGGT